MLLCLLLLHSPDGSVLAVEGMALQVIHDVERYQGHIAKGTRSIVYVGGRAFGVRESREEVTRLRTECDEHPTR